VKDRGGNGTERRARSRARARRIAREVSESFHRRLVASGVDKSQARARGADAEVGGVIGPAKHQRGNVQRDCG
jgi:hypothetical protein